MTVERVPLRTRSVAAGLGLAGLAVIVVGTFLPWLRSGQARRNSYQTGGALQRVLDVHGALDGALSVWPFVGLTCAVAVALFALGLHRTAAVAAAVTAAVAGAVSVAALSADGAGFVVPVRVGPAVTLAGALAVVTAASLVLAARRPVRVGEGSAR